MLDLAHVDLEPLIAHIATMLRTRQPIEAEIKDSAPVAMAIFALWEPDAEKYTPEQIWTHPSFKTISFALSTLLHYDRHQFQNLPPITGVKQ